jgi:hypothetical protein
MSSQPLKLISVELLNKLANFLATSVGHTYLETDAIIKEISNLPDGQTIQEVKEDKKEK